MANILILEDNIDLSFYWSELLAAQGHMIEYRTNANISANLLHDLDVDLIIVDMFFQESDGLYLHGLAFLEKLDQMTTNKKPKVIAVSGQDIEVSILDVAQVLGVDSTLRKPIQPQQLVDTVNHLLNATEN